MMSQGSGRRWGEGLRVGSGGREMGWSGMEGRL